jgi:hypothetical protein
MRGRLPAIAAVITMSWVGHATAQSSTPEGALEELATASSAEIVLRHLPVSTAEIINKLPPRTKAQVLEHLVPAKKMETEGVALRRAANGRAWEVVKKVDDTVEDTVEVTDSFVTGDRALLVISKRSSGQLTPEEVMVGMRLEQGDWRLAEFGPWERHAMKDIFADKLETPARNESMAANILRRVATALAKYVENYPAIGFPDALSALRCCDDEPSPEHAGLIDQRFASNVLNFNGYEFRYASNGRSHYTITAVPVEWQETGTKSFFVDESGIIRVTVENRKAGPGDQPLAEETSDEAEAGAID